MDKNSSSPIPRVERINLLMDIYGDLLTDKQRRFVMLHYGEDLSFGEIAEEYNVSRQAIYDAVKHAMANLERYEKTLSLLDRYESEEGGSDGGGRLKKNSDSAIDNSEAIQALKQLRIKMQKQNIIYNVDRIVHEISRIIEMIEGRQEESKMPLPPES